MSDEIKPGHVGERIKFSRIIKSEFYATVERSTEKTYAAQKRDPFLDDRWNTWVEGTAEYCHGWLDGLTKGNGLDKGNWRIVEIKKEEGPTPDPAPTPPPAPEE